MYINFSTMTFTIAPTRTTPLAEFKDGYLVIKGKSVPFDHPEMYDIIRERLLTYSQKPEKNTRVDFYLSAVNAVSKRSIIHIFRILENIVERGTEVQVNWHYESDDEDLLELGEICKGYFRINIQLKEGM